MSEESWYCGIADPTLNASPSPLNSMSVDLLAEAKASEGGIRTESNDCEGRRCAIGAICETAHVRLM